MNIFDICIVIGIAGWLAVSVCLMIRAKKKGKLSCGNCSSCGESCAACKHKR